MSSFLGPAKGKEERTFVKIKYKTLHLGGTLNCENRFVQAFWSDFVFNKIKYGCIFSEIKLTYELTFKQVEFK